MRAWKSLIATITACGGLCLTACESSSPKPAASNFNFTQAASSTADSSTSARCPLTVADISIATDVPVQQITGGDGRKGASALCSFLADNGITASVLRRPPGETLASERAANSEFQIVDTPARGEGTFVSLDPKSQTGRAFLPQFFILYTDPTTSLEILGRRLNTLADIAL